MNVIDELLTIKAIIPPTVKIYEETEEIKDILPNLSMIQIALDYLKDMANEEEKEDKLKKIKIDSYGKVPFKKGIDNNGNYTICIAADQLKPGLLNPELFEGVLDQAKVIEVDITFPVVCGREYTIKQYNPALQYFPHDEYIHQEGKKWYKEKTYTMNEDEFGYGFLLQEGFSDVTITVTSSEGEESYNISSHIHFKKEE